MFFVNALDARLGESLDQAQSRYGKLVKTVGSHSALVFKKGKYHVTTYWLNKKVCGIAYHRGQKMSETEISTLLKINEDTEWKHSWKLTRDEYSAKSGNYGIYDPVKKELFIATPKYPVLLEILEKERLEGL